MPPLASSVTPVYGAFTVPLGNVGPVDIVGPGVMVSEKTCVPDPPALSVTFTPKLTGPGDGGVPVRAPAGLSDSQDGTAGVPGDHVKPVPEPPEAERVCEYGAVASPFGNVAAVVMLGPALTVMVKT